jgi:hypothetical protein
MMSYVFCNMALSRPLKVSGVRDVISQKTEHFKIAVIEVLK